MGPLQEHLDSLRLRGRADSTVVQRRNALQRLRRAVPGGLLEVTPDQLYAFVSRPSLDHEARATEISHLKQFYKWAVKTDRLAADPSLWLERPKLGRRLPRPMFEEDVKMARDLAPERIKPWILLAAWAGLRCAEIASLRAEDLWFQQDPPIIVVRDGKGGVDGSVAVSQWLVAELVDCRLPRRGYLFGRRDGQPGHVPPHLVSHLGNGFLHSIGISDTMHQLRHRFGTQFYRASGRDLRMTQEQLRHRSPTSTAIYTFVDPAEAGVVAERIPV